ncbi:MAG: patatin-like phospholipase family protein [Eubacteriales bacterium]
MYGLVLEGGGAKGSYHIGAWSALRKLGIEFSGAVGTSVGALNAAVILQGDYDAARELWENMTFSSVFNMNDGIFEKIIDYTFKSKDVMEYRDELNTVLKIDGLDITPLKATIRKLLKENDLRKMNKLFGLVTISLAEMKGLELFLEDIPNGHLADMLLASSYLPVFKLEKLHGKMYLDGGYYNNLPTRMLVRKGYKDIIEIRLHDDAVQFPVNNEEINIVRIEPKENLGSALDFNNERIQYNMILGYYDTLRTFHHLNGEKYYIRIPFEEKEILMFLLENREKFKDIAQTMGIYQELTCPILLEILIPTLKENLGMQEKIDYREFIAGILEYIGDKLHIYRFRVYDLAEFLQFILKHNDNLYMKDFSLIEKIKKNHLLTKEIIDLIKGGLQIEEMSTE